MQLALLRHALLVAALATSESQGWRVWIASWLRLMREQQGYPVRRAHDAAYDTRCPHVIAGRTMKRYGHENAAVIVAMPE